METATKTSNMHIGRKISRIRELRGMKQESMAIELGISQQTVSKIEQSEIVEPETLDRIARVLGVSAEGIKHFTEESVFNNINNFHDNSIQNNFNPIDKLLEVIEENKKLYERLLQSERDKIELLKNPGK